MIKKFKMRGLDSVHSVKKIEHEVKSLESVNNAYYNLANEEMLIEFKSDADVVDEFHKIKKIVKNTELDVHVSCKGLKSESNFGLLNGYLFFAIGIILFFVEYLFLDNFYIMIFSFILVANMPIRKSASAFVNGVAIDENLLLVLGTIGAIYIKSYLEAVLVISFYTVGEFLQEKALKHTKREINSLRELKSSVINVVRGSVVELVEVSDLKKDNIILVKKGDTLPVDGVVVSGNSFFDTRYVTGKGKPVAVTPGTKVLSGIINIDNTIEVRVLANYSESGIAKLVELIKDSTFEKGDSQKTLTRFSKYYAPLIILATVGVFFVPVYIMKQDMDASLVRACTFILMACPCALVLSVPMAYWAALNRSEKNGILYKGCNYIDAVNQVDNIFIDKTETVVTDHMKVIASTSPETIKLAASIEKYSKHPIAKAIVAEADDLYEVVNAQKFSNKGLRGFIDGKELVVGNKSLMNEYGIYFTKHESHYTQIFVGFDGQYIGKIELDDVIKPESIDAFEYFKSQDINITFLSNDNMAKAQKLSKDLGVNYRQGLLPGDKIVALDEVGDKAFTMFIGDGENDAPALMNADIGVATGSYCSDLSLEVSDIIVLEDDISKLKNMFMIARKTKNVVIINILISMIVKLVFLVFGAMDQTTVLWALLADIILAVAASLNSLRILKH